MKEFLDSISDDRKSRIKRRMDRIIEIEKQMAKITELEYDLNNEDFEKSLDALKKEKNNIFETLQKSILLYFTMYVVNNL